MARLPFAWLGLTYFFRVSVCFAQPELPVQLEWSAPASCPQQDDVQQQLMALLGPANGTSATAPLNVNGAIEPVSEHYRLTLRLERSSNRGTRTIESDDCKSLGKAAAVIVGLLVQKERLLGRELSNDELSGQTSAPPPPEVTPPPPKTEGPPTIPPKASEPTSPPRRWHLLLRVPEAKVDALLLPRSSRGLGVSVGLSMDSWRVLMGGAVFESQTHTTTGLPQEFTAKYRHWALEALGCRGFRSGPFEVAPCANVAGDYIASSASGTNLASTNQSSIVYSIGAGISGYFHLHQYFALVASASSRLALNRPRFIVPTPAKEQDETAHNVPLGTLGVGIAAEWIF